MSDAQAATHNDTTTELFEKSELQQFVADDQAAGRAICKMLSALFVYTLFAMSVAAGWTYYATL